MKRSYRHDHLTTVFGTMGQTQRMIRHLRFAAQESLGRAQLEVYWLRRTTVRQFEKILSPLLRQMGLHSVAVCLST